MSKNYNREWFIFIAFYSPIQEENDVLLDSLLKKVEEAEGTLGSEISKKLRNIIENTGLEKLANVLTEEEVASGEQEKINEILRNQFGEDDQYIPSDNEKLKHLNNDLKTSSEAIKKLDHDSIEKRQSKDRKPDELWWNTFDENDHRFGAFSHKQTITWNCDNKQLVKFGEYF